MLLERKTLDNTVHQRGDLHRRQVEPQSGAVGDGFGDGQFEVNDVILRHESDPGGIDLFPAGERDAADENVAGTGGIDAAERVEQRRFSLAAPAENAHEFPALNFEVDVLEDAERLAVLSHLDDETMRGNASEVRLIDADNGVSGELEKIIADPETVTVDEHFTAEEFAVEFGTGTAFVDDEEVRPHPFR